MVTKNASTGIERFLKARVLINDLEPWYGDILSNFTYTEANWCPTMGVRFTVTGSVELVYNTEFLDSQSTRQIYSTIKHEIGHIVGMHQFRLVDAEYQWLARMCMEKAVNGLSSRPRIAFPHANPQAVYENELPLDGKIVWCESAKEESQVVEELYRDAEKQVSKLKAIIAKAGMVDDHGVWDEDGSGCSEETARAAVSAMVNTASSKFPGNVPGHMKTDIEALGKSRVPWTRYLERAIQDAVGAYRQPTYSRRNRRLSMPGIPGRTRRGATVNVIIDTSGSTASYIPSFFAEVDKLSRYAEVSVLQWDCAFQGFAPYRYGDWQHIKCKGGGGTDMAAPVEWLKSNRRVADFNILLTDGYCSYASRQSFKMLTVICTRDGHSPDWGQTLRITDYVK